MKVNNAANSSMKSSGSASGDDRFFAECELSIVRLTPGFHAMVKRDLTPVVLSNVLPMQVSDLVPSAADDSDTHAEMNCERYCYFIDRLPSGPG